MDWEAEVEVDESGTVREVGLMMIHERGIRVSVSDSVNSCFQLSAGVKYTELYELYTLV